jgi:hypothetical protein
LWVSAGVTLVASQDPLFLGCCIQASLHRIHPLVVVIIRWVLQPLRRRGVAPHCLNYIITAFDLPLSTALRVRDCHSWVGLAPPTLELVVVHCRILPLLCPPASRMHAPSPSQRTASRCRRFGSTLSSMSSLASMQQRDLGRCRLKKFHFMSSFSTKSSSCKSP